MFAQRLSLDAERTEDLDSARLVIRLQSGERELFESLYQRYFDRVYSYLRVVLHDRYEAEDATQQVFLQVLEALPNFELRDVPVRAWLFRIVRNYALNQLKRLRRLAVEDPVSLDRRREVESTPVETEALEWLTDTDLVILVGRLPLAQRQVMMLRYMMDLSWSEIAAVLGRSPAAVRQLQARALAQLRTQLTNTGLGDRPASRLAMARRAPGLPVLYARRRALLRAA